jgi:hypothetical protein
VNTRIIQTIFMLNSQQTKKIKLFKSVWYHNIVQHVRIHRKYMHLLIFRFNSYHFMKICVEDPFYFFKNVIASVIMPLIFFIIFFLRMKARYPQDFLLLDINCRFNLCAHVRYIYALNHDCKKMKINCQLLNKFKRNELLNYQI